MSGYKLKHMTPYYSEVVAKLREIAAGRGMVGQGELAQMLGRKVTKSFRRALTQAELDGYVTKAYFYTSKGGRAVGYEVHTDLVQLRLPFESGYPF